MNSDLKQRQRDFGPKRFRGSYVDIFRTGNSQVNASEKFAQYFNNILSNGKNQDKLQITTKLLQQNMVDTYLHLLVIKTIRFTRD